MRYFVYLGAFSNFLILILCQSIEYHIKFVLFLSVHGLCLIYYQIWVMNSLITTTVQQLNYHPHLVILFPDTFCSFHNFLQTSTFEVIFFRLSKISCRVPIHYVWPLLFYSQFSFMLRFYYGMSLLVTFGQLFLIIRRRLLYLTKLWFFLVWWLFTSHILHP